MHLLIPEIILVVAALAALAVDLTVMRRAALPNLPEKSVLPSPQCQTGTGCPRNV